MTLKSFSFSPKLFANRLGRTGWIGLLYSIVLFFNFPVNLLLRLSAPARTYSQYLTEEQVELAKRFARQEQIHSVFNDGGSGIIVLVVLMAVFSAVFLFAYLSNRSQVDFYHSQPVKRSQLFTMNFFTGLLYFVIPLAGSLLLCVLILLFSGNLPLLPVSILFRCFSSAIVEYLAVYSLSILAGMLTGTVIAHVLGCAVLLILLPAIAAIPYFVFDLFYEHFYTTFPLMEFLGYLSPVFAFASAENDIGMSLPYTLYYIAVSVVLLVGSMLLYQRRASETAGKTISFPHFGFGIKHVMALTLSVYGGLFFQEISSGSDTNLLWFFFGVVCAGLLCYMIIQAVFAQEIRAAYRKLWQLLIPLGVVMAVLCVPVFDLTGYDAYLPQREDVVAVRANFRDFDYYILSDMTEKEQQSLRYEAPEVIDAVHAAAESALSPQDEYGYNPINLCFELKNGRKVYRTYQRPQDDFIWQAYQTTYESEEYRAYREQYGNLTLAEEHILRIYDAQNRNYLAVSGYTPTFATPGLPVLTPEQRDTLIETYNRDRLDRSLQALTQQTPIAIFEAVQWGVRGHEYYMGEWEIYPCDTRTLSLLENYGISIRIMNKEPVSSLTVYVRMALEEKEPVSPYTEVVVETQKAPVVTYLYEEDSIKFEITDPEQIEEIMAVAVLDRYSYNPFLRLGHDITLEPVFTDQTLRNQTYQFYLPMDLIPDFLQEMAEQAIAQFSVQQHG